MAEKVKRALIVGAAPDADLSFLKEEAGDWWVICADGGIKTALAAGLRPDCLIGDWDSGGSPAGEVPCTTLPAEKDFTEALSINPDLVDAERLHRIIGKLF